MVMHACNSPETSDVTQCMLDQYWTFKECNRWVDQLNTLGPTPGTLRKQLILVGETAASQAFL